MIILILIFALILRLVNLNQSLWLDEAVQAITAQNSPSYIFQEITGDFHPPLYYFLMHFWVRIFGSSEIALRMPSVLFGVGAVYIVYKISHLSSSRNLGYLSALFLATAPFHVYYSQEARMYSMTTFFAALSMYFFMKINEFKNYRDSDLDGGISFLNHKRKGFLDPSTPSTSLRPSALRLRLEEINPFRAGLARNDNALYFISTLLMIYSDYYGFLVLLAQMTFLLIRKKYKYLFICLFAYLLIYIPWLPMFITQIKTGMAATQILPGWGKLANVSFIKAIPLTLIKFTIGRITIFNKIIYGLVSLGILGMLGVLGNNFYKCYKKESKSFFTIILLWFLVPLIVSWAVSLVIPNFQPFRLLLILPAFYLILSMGAERPEGNRWIRRFAIAAILTINLVSLSVYFFNPYFWREDWKGLVKHLVAQENSIVILPSSASNWPIKYYDTEKKINLLAGINGVGKIGSVRDVEEIGGGNKIYFIRYLVTLFDPDEKILQELDDRGYTKVKEISFNQIPVWIFSTD